MFGNLGQIAHLLKNAGKIKDGMKDMQERLAAARFVGEAGGGQVQATVDGKGEPLRVKIDPALFKAGDVEMVEDLVCAALAAAVRTSRAGVQKEMEAITGGMDLSGVMDMLGGKP